MDKLPPEVKTFVCEELPNADLARLARVDSLWKATALLTLYNRESRAGDFEATGLSTMIRMACRDDPDIDQDAVLEGFRNLIAAFKRTKHIFNINALTGFPTECHTALTVAAKSVQTDDQVTWMRRLIEEGASVNVQCSRNFTFADDLVWVLPSDNNPGLGNRRRLHLVRKRVLEVVRHYTCLFHPMTSRNSKVLDLLLNQPSVDPRLAYPPADGFGAEDATFTILHGLAMHSADFTELSRRMLDRYQSLMDTPVPVPHSRGPGAKAIHLAILARNKPMLKLLVRYGADLNAEMDVDHVAPLHLIIEQMRDTEGSRDRKFLAEYFQRLLRAGANPNHALPVGHRFTPLLTLIESMRSFHSWPKLMKDTAKALLDHGADPNIPDTLGHTPLDLLAVIVVSDVSTSGVVAGAVWFINLLIDHYEADPNLFNATNDHSLFGLILKQHVARGDSFMSLLKQLYERGARFGRDLNECFDWWLGDTALMKLYDMKQHKGQLDQRKINAAYLSTLRGENPWKNFQFLQERMPGPNNDSELLWEAFEPRNFQIRAVITLLNWNWDPNYVHPTTGTDIMAQVIKCACAPNTGYTPKAAARHCKILIERGASVRRQDPMGMTPIRYLWENTGPQFLWGLKALVSEQNARENGDI